ncbi:sigma-70 family RNA polymerase sigma factor, partial [Salmonella enterica]|uniref:sigma-70 family RNA polymerase sigma factor n=1 Tax=Salmonella enterica TaxID=28901 RepID=UPI0015CBCE41
TGFRAEASPLTWLMKIATHHCLNVMRGERAAWRERFERQELARGEATVGPHAFELREEVRRMLALVDVDTQQAAIH